MSTVQQHWGLGFLNGSPDKQFIAGIEYEIEAIKDYADIGHEGIFTVETDNSLRNNGREFKTIPMSFKEHLEAFKSLHSRLKLGKDPFSERTSIHVHVNVRELELNQVRQFILCYALLEPLFFEYVGDVRKNSIFCVPLNYTYLPNMYKHNVQTLKEKWHKYTAFNILPLDNFGTVEFRHMYGTADFDKFSKWLTALKELYDFIAFTEEFDLIKELERGKGLSIIAHAIVPTLASGYSPAALDALLEDTLLDVKLSVGGLK